MAALLKPPITLSAERATVPQEGVCERISTRLDARGSNGPRIVRSMPPCVGVRSAVKASLVRPHRSHADRATLAAR